MKSGIKILSVVMSVAIVAITFMTSCEEGRSYAELLDDENKAVNRFLVNHRVETSIPADTVFEVGADAPYYQLDDEGNIYMQVLNAGSGEKVKDDQLVYFRFMRYNLMGYYDTLDGIIGEGNQDNMSQEPSSFRFNNYSIPSSSQWGSGLQRPLAFLPLNCDVNLIVKSQYGWTNEISYVQPYLYRIRYYKSMI